MIFSLQLVIENFGKILIFPGLKAILASVNQNFSKPISRKEQLQ